jgi:hypothetical protein
MDRFLAVSCLALGVVLLGFVGAAAYYPPATHDADTAYTANGAILIAKQFVQSEATYKYDGMADTLKVSLGRTIADGHFEIVAEFTSAQGGYGDRTGQMVVQVLTPHRAVIEVEKGRVTAAVMDGQWDMLSGKLVDAGRPAGMPALDPGSVDANVTVPVDGLQR